MKPEAQRFCCLCARLIQHLQHLPVGSDTGLKDVYSSLPILSWQSYLKKVKPWMPNTNYVLLPLAVPNTHILLRGLQLLNRTYEPGDTTWEVGYTVYLAFKWLLASSCEHGTMPFEGSRCLISHASENNCVGEP